MLLGTLRTASFPEKQRRPCLFRHCCLKSGRAALSCPEGNCFVASACLSSDHKHLSFRLDIHAKQAPLAPSTLQDIAPTSLHQLTRVRALLASAAQQVRPDFPRVTRGAIPGDFRGGTRLRVLGSLWRRAVGCRFQGTHLFCRREGLFVGLQWRRAIWGRLRRCVGRIWRVRRRGQCRILCATLVHRRLIGRGTGGRPCSHLSALPETRRVSWHGKHLIVTHVRYAITH